MEIKILLIDDDLELPSPLAIFLFDSGYHVLNIADIADSYEIIAGHNPDIILLNNFSEAEDINIFQKIKKVSSVNSKLIFISENSVKTDWLTHSLKSGADHYILRPVSNNELLVKIKEISNLSGWTIG